MNIKLYFASNAVLNAVFIRTLGDTMEMLATVLLYLIIGLGSYALGCWVGRR